MVRTWCLHCCSLGSVPSLGSEILTSSCCMLQPQEKKKEKEKRTREYLRFVILKRRFLGSMSKCMQILSKLFK